MRSKIDAKIDRRGKRKKPTRPPGGKALRRLFSFIGERDPALNNEIAAMFAVPKAARPKFLLTKKTVRAISASKAKPARRGRRRATSPAAKPFAQAIAKAAVALSSPTQRRHAAGRKAKAVAAVPAAAGPAAAAASWQFIGPSHIPNGQTYGTNRVDVIGRVASIAIDPTNPKHVLLGAAGGGIWESKDTGANWEPRTDQMPSLAIGAVAFDPANAKIVYAGSGEGNFYFSIGAGVYKSTDGGTSWTALVSAPFVGAGFFDLVVDPQDSKVLYAATISSVANKSGFYKSTNSGASWSLKRAGICWDISVHPNGGSVELLATFEDGLFVSANAGNSFTPVALPSGPTSDWTRLAVDRVRTAPEVAYVFGAVGTVPHLWRRAGGTWSKITSLPRVDKDEPWTSQAEYNWYVAATPDNQRQIYLGAIDIFRGTLSGSTWAFKNISTQGSNSIHPDQHCLTYSPDDSKVIYAGNDGGIFRSANSGAKWKELNKGLGITEIEYLAGDPNTWKWVMAGLQDNGTIRFTGSPKWDHIADGDGGDCAVNELDPKVVYHSFYEVSLERSRDKGDTWNDLEPGKDLKPAQAASLFYPPVEVSGLTVGIGARSLVVTRTGGKPWTPVALGLGAEEMPSAMRAIDANTFLIGTTVGRMLKLTWTGATWKKVLLTSPAPRYVSCITVDPSNPQRFWVTISQIGGGLVYRSNDAGASWTDCTDGLPKIPINSVVVDSANFKRVWVAADVGVYQTMDLGSSWSAFSNGLPNAMAVDLLFHKQDRMLICGTRNRGAWVIAV